jgi:hypothetical protein
VRNVALLVYKPSCVNTSEGTKEDKPVVDGALGFEIIAWQLSIERSDTHSRDTVIVCKDNLALVILGARVQVVAWSTEGWNANTEAKWPNFRLNFHAVAWALVAHTKVEVTVLATGCAKVAWRGDAAKLLSSASARAQTCET